MRAVQTQLIPIQEMTPGALAELRNSVISKVVDLATKEIGLPARSLIVRDILPSNDLLWKFSTTSSATTGESFNRNMTEATIGYVTVATGNMTNERFVSIFGLRDGRITQGATNATAITTVPTNATAQTGDYFILNIITFVRFTIGGGIRAVWDSSSMLPYLDKVAFCPSAIIIPQNTAYTISFYHACTEGNDVAVAELSTYLQLIGVTVEPRGRLVTA